MARCLDRSRRRCFGLFLGWEGSVGGRLCAVAVTGDGENPLYVALRQMAHIFQPQIAVALEPVSAVAEGLHGGDFVLIREAARCLVPAGLARNICDDRYLFPSEAIRREILEAPAVASDAEGLAIVAEALAHNMPAESVQPEVPVVRAGCSGFWPQHQSVRNWVRSRFVVEVVAAGVNGFLSAAHDLRLPALATGVVADGCSDDDRLEFRRHRRRYLRAAAVLSLRGAMAWLSRTPQTVSRGPRPSA
ncbi:MAG: hypothetical protein N2111_01455 [Candidatus Sumerlaeaceae bacterium]|nr:hypothetical protein [Candidatus Sumerlaeaceae bacterium]